MEGTTQKRNGTQLRSSGEAKGRMRDQANATSGTRRWGRIVVLCMVLVSLFSVAGAWWYINREVPPTVLTVGAGPYRSDSYELMKEAADVLDRHNAAVRLKVIATNSSSRNISMLNDRKFDLATIRSDTPVISDVRLVANLFPDYFQLITRVDSGISQVTDLIGKRVAVPRFGTDELRSFWILGDHYDIAINSVKWKPVEIEDATRQLLNNDVDAIFTVRSLRDRHLLNLFEDAGLKRVQLGFLEIDQAPAIALKRPFITTGKVPKGAFVGSQPTPRHDAVTSAVNRILVTREDVDPEAINQLTRILFEQRLDLVIRFALASAIQQPDNVSGLSMPLHDGAEQFYNRDQPSFLQENAEPIALVITIFAMMGSGLIALRGRLVNTQKDRMDSYNYILLDLAESARAANSQLEISPLKDEMFRVLEKVVRALDTDEVTEEGFQSFSLLFESVREVINDRAREISDGSDK